MDWKNEWASGPVGYLGKSRPKSSSKPRSAPALLSSPSLLLRRPTAPPPTIWNPQLMSPSIERLRSPPRCGHSAVNETHRRSLLGPITGECPAPAIRVTQAAMFPRPPTERLALPWNHLCSLVDSEAHCSLFVCVSVGVNRNWNECTLGLQGDEHFCGMQISCFIRISNSRSLISQASKAAFAPRLLPY